MSDWLVFGLGAAATARLTRLVTTDTILDGLRERVTAWAQNRRRNPDTEHPVEELLSCNWCIGVWCAGAVWAVTWWAHPLPLPGLWLGAMAWAGAWLAGRE